MTCEKCGNQCESSPCDQCKRLLGDLEDGLRRFAVTMNARTANGEEYRPRDLAAVILSAHVFADVDVTEQLADLEDDKEKAGRVTPYFSDGQVELYLGDCREVLPSLGVTADLIVADPPYESTGLPWDRWPDGWLEVAAAAARSMWCFLPLRQFAEPPYRGLEFRAAGWRLSHDIAWEKSNGSGPAGDRFRGVHEPAAHWYRGPWRDVYHEVPRVPATPEQVARNGTAQRQRKSAVHLGAYGTARPWTDDGTRLMRSVIKAPNLRGKAIAPTEKPVPLLVPLIEYACPPGGLVVAPFAGSGSDLEAARLAGVRAIGIERDPEQAEKAALRLSRQPLTAVETAT